LSLGNDHKNLGGDGIYQQMKAQMKAQLAKIEQSNKSNGLAQ